MDGEEFVEDALVGSELVLGDAVLRLELATPRCIVPTLAAGGRPHNLDVLRALARHHRIRVGNSAVLRASAAELRDGEARMRAAEILSERQEEKLALSGGLADAVTTGDEAVSQAHVIYRALLEHVGEKGELSEAELSALVALDQQFQGRFREYVATVDLVAQVASAVAATVVAVVAVAVSGGTLAPAVARNGEVLIAMASTENDIPEALLQRYPELAAVGEALRQYRAGEQVTAICVKCGQPLSVVDSQETGALLVTCPAGDTGFRAKRSRMK